MNTSPFAALAGALMFCAAFTASPRASATECDAIAITADCIDPQFNESNFVIDSVSEETSPAPHTRVRAHFEPAPSSRARRLDMNFYFPPADKWEGRFFQHVYPLNQGERPHDVAFALSSGGFLVEVLGGGLSYRADAAAARLARAYAARHYNTTRQINGYIFGGSGGSIQTLSAIENTIGVWQGGVPYVIANEANMMHRPSWNGFIAFALGADAESIADAVSPGGSGDPFAALDEDERAALREALNFGAPLRSFEGFPFYLDGRVGGMPPTPRPPAPAGARPPGGGGAPPFGGFAAMGLGAAFADNFWSSPGYAGAAPPSYLRAALVDHTSTITRIERGADATRVELDSAPTLGTVGDGGLEMWLYAADGQTRIPGAFAAERHGNVLDVANDAPLLASLVVGGKVRFTNRSTLPRLFMHRHTIPPTPFYIYDQYRGPDGALLHAQVSGMRAPAPAAGAPRPAAPGNIRARIIVVDNLLDADAYPWGADWYTARVREALGERGFQDNFRVYFTDNSDHMDDAVVQNFKAARMVNYNPMLYQALRDVAAWVERGMAPPASTRYRMEGGQVAVPPRATARRGIQPVVDLSVSGGERIVVGLNQPVRFRGRIEAPPGAGRIVSTEWYFSGPTPSVLAAARPESEGGVPNLTVTYEPPEFVQNPRRSLIVQRTHAFTAPGTYFVTLRASSQRDGIRGDPATIQNLDRVRVVVE